MCIQIEDLFDRSTTASDCCDANRGRFDDWAPSMDELDAFECEVDNAKEALASKLAVILFMECEVRIDDWLDRELMLRLALVLEEDKDEVVEGGRLKAGCDFIIIYQSRCKCRYGGIRNVGGVCKVECGNGSGGGGGSGGDLAGGIDLILPITNIHAH